MLAYTFEGLDLNSINDDEFTELRRAVPVHGVVCVKAQSLDVPALINFSQRFGQSVLLPPGLRFNNTVSEFPELARVSNILPNGEKIKKHQAAEYWHVDGDFWQPGQNYIFNFLYSVLVPKQGGQTGFIDLRSAYRCLSDELKARVADLSFISSCADIPDFDVASPEEYLPEACHPIKHLHPETGLEGLYINYPTTKLVGMTQLESEQLLSEVFKQIDIKENRYIHNWERGDLLIWDNTSVMHRSLGGYGDCDRLLYRTQAFIKPLAA